MNLQDYALLTTGKLHLLLPQEQIEDVAHIQDRRVAEQQTVSSTAVLAQRLDSHDSAFVSLSDNLSLLPQIPRSAFVQTTWHVAPHISWCWAEVKWLNQVSLKTQAIPSILAVDGLAAQAITTLDDGTVAFVCDSEALLQFILNRQED